MNLNLKIFQTIHELSEKNLSYDFYFVFKLMVLVKGEWVATTDFDCQPRSKSLDFKTWDSRFGTKVQILLDNLKDDF